MHEESAAAPSPPRYREPPALVPEPGGTAERVLEAVCSNDISALRAKLYPGDPSCQELCSERYNYNGVRGTLLCHAVYHHRKKAANYILDCPGTDIMGSEAVLLCVRQCKYDMGLFLLAKPAADVNWKRPTDGNTVLHCVCSRPKPPVQFIAELCRLKALRVNTKNAAGHAPIHLLAMHSKGVEGRDAAQLLRAKGALLDMRDGEGRTPIEMCQNSFLREVLCMSSLAVGLRQDPSNSLTDEEKQRLDEMSSERLHQKVDKLLRDAAAAKDQLKEEAFAESAGSEVLTRRRRKRLQQDEVEGLVSRLYTQTLQRTEETKREQQRQLDKEAKANSKKLGVTEQEDCVERLYGAAIQKISETRQVLAEKYPEASAEAKTLSPDDLTESIQRLYSQSLEKREESRQRLRDTYLPVTLVEKRCGGTRLDKEATTASVNRLYGAAKEKQSQTLDALRAKYLVTSPKRQLSPALIAKSVERLAAK